MIFPGYLFCDPHQLWSQAFLCLATVFGKHTDRRLDSRYACEIDVGENTDSACSVSFRFRSFRFSKYIYKIGTFTFENKVMLSFFRLSQSNYCHVNFIIPVCNDQS